jgi:hypothetical protein
MICLQKRVIDHIEYSISLGWGVAREPESSIDMALLVEGALLKVLVCRCGMWGRGLAGWRCVLTIAEHTWDGHLWTVAESRRCGADRASVYPYTSALEQRFKAPIYYVLGVEGVPFEDANIRP